MKFRWAIAAGCFGAYLSLSAIASAQAPAATAAPSPPPPSVGISDVVQLKDGSMVRGTIIELRSGVSVTIELPTGQTREFKMDEVLYAGAFAAAPQPAAVAAPAPGSASVAPAGASPPAGPNGPPPNTAKIRLEAAEPLTFSVATSTSEASIASGRHTGANILIEHFDRLCTAPCDAELPSGRYRFSLTKDEGTLSVRNEVPVSPGDTLKGEIKSFRTMRIAGLVIGGAALVGGSIYAFSGPSVPDCGSTPIGPGFDAALAQCSQQQSDAESARTNRLIVGSIVSSVGLVVGIVLGLKSDEAIVTVVPGVAPIANARGFDSRRSLSAAYAPAGLTLGAHF